jgi:hypothetical protein
MGLFVPLYGPFRACLKWAVPVPAHGPRPRPKLGPIYRAVSCLGRAFFPCFGLAHQPPAQMYTYISHRGSHGCISSQGWSRASHEHPPL